MKNMEEAFYLLSCNANKVVLYDSPSQSLGLRMYGGTLGQRDDGYIDISFTYNNGGAQSHSTINLTDFEYVMSDKKIAYLMGGVCKKYGSNPSIMVYDPLIYMYDTGTTKTLFIPLTVYQPSTSALSGTGQARVLFYSPYYLSDEGTLSYPLTIKADNVTEIYIKMESSYSDSFKKYFEDNLGFTKYNNTTMNKTYPSPGISLYIPISDIGVTVN
jgi:hypothetical protein